MDLDIIDKGQKPLVITFGKKFYLCDFLENMEIDNINIMLDPPWYNNIIVKIQYKSVFCKALYEKGFYIVHDLFEFITNDYPVKIPFTTYEAL